MYFVEGLDVERIGCGDPVGCGYPEQASTRPCTRLLLNLLYLVREAADSTVLGTVAVKSAFLAEDNMVTLVAQTHTHCTDSLVAGQPTGIAVVPVLLLVLLARFQESALLLWLGHVLRVVRRAVIERLLSEPLQQSLRLLLLASLYSLTALVQGQI